MEAAAEKGKEGPASTSGGKQAAPAEGGLGEGDRCMIIYYKDKKEYPATLGPKTAGGWTVLWDSGETSNNVNAQYCTKIHVDLPKVAKSELPAGAAGVEDEEAEDKQFLKELDAIPSELSEASAVPETTTDSQQDCKLLLNISVTEQPVQQAEQQQEEEKQQVEEQQPKEQKRAKKNKNARVRKKRAKAKAKGRSEAELDRMYPGSNLCGTRSWLVDDSLDQLQQQNSKPVPLRGVKIPGPGAHTPHGGQFSSIRHAYSASTSISSSKPPEYTLYKNDRNYEFALGNAALAKLNPSIHHDEGGSLAPQTINIDHSPGPIYYPKAPEGRNPHASFTKHNRFRRGGPRAPEGGESIWATTSRITPGVGSYDAPSVNNYKFASDGVELKTTSKLGSFSQAEQRHHVADAKARLMMSARPFISECHMRENFGIHSPGPAAYSSVEQGDRSVRLKRPEFSFSKTQREVGSNIALLVAANVSPGPNYDTCTKASSKVGCTLPGSQAPAFGFGTAPRLNKMWEEMERKGIPLKNEVSKQRFICAKQMSEPNGVWSPGPIYFPKSTIGKGVKVGICESSRWK